MTSFLNDLRHAFRALTRAKGFALAAIVALALGIGANTAVFSLMHTVVLTPLPFQEPDRVVALWGTGPKAGWTTTLSYPRLHDWMAKNRTFEAIAGVRKIDLDLAGLENPLKVRGGAVVGDFFRVVKVKPLLGRTLQASDPEGAPVVVLGEGIWKRAFGGDPAILGKSILLNGRACTVAGILPSAFAFNGIEAFLPMTPTEVERNHRNENFIHACGRLKPGVTVAQAQADLRSMCDGLAAAYPETDARRGALVRDFRIDRFGKPDLLVLVGLASALVLLMACINVANQLLARATDRMRDMAVRSAVGGNTLQILAPNFAESLLISLAGAAAGLLVARLSLELLRPTVPPDLLQAQPLELHALALCLTLLTALLTAFLCGSAPGLLLTRFNLAQTLKEGARGSSGSGHRLRNALVTAQVALALVLSVGFLAAYRSIRDLGQVPLGFDAKGVSAFQAQVPSWKYPTPLAQHRAAQAMVEAVRNIPGVTAAGFLTQMPVQEYGWNTSVGFHGQEAREEDVVEHRGLGDGALRALGVPILQGRDFTPQDTEESGVALVSQSLAQRYFPGQDPLNQDISVDGAHFRIAGVTGTVRNGGPKYAGAQDTLYLPGPRGLGEKAVFWIFFKSQPTGDAMLAPVRQALRRVDPDLPVNEIRTMEREIATSVDRERVQAMLLGLFAILAITLAILGIHGAMAYAVAQRAQEIGIRMSLGATPGQVMAQFLREGLTLAGIGLAIGLAGALAFSSALRALIFGMKATDPYHLSGAVLALLTLSAAASLLPARRAARLDPALALRNE